jgi:hypothetical protein
LEITVEFFGSREEDHVVYIIKPRAMIFNEIPSQIEMKTREEDLVKDIQARIEKFTKSSNLQFVRVVSAGVLFADYNPLQRGRAYVELPEYLEKKKAIVNVQNRDNRCFGYALLSWLLYDEVCYSQTYI